MTTPTHVKEAAEEKSIGQVLFETENPFPAARSWAECHPKVQALHETIAQAVEDHVLKHLPRASEWEQKAVRVLKKVQAIGDSYNWRQASDARRFVLQDVNSVLNFTPAETHGWVSVEDFFTLASEMQAHLNDAIYDIDHGNDSRYLRTLRVKTINEFEARLSKLRTAFLSKNDLEEAPSNSEPVEKENWRIASDVDRCSNPKQLLEWLQAVECALVECHYADAEYALSVPIKALERQLKEAAVNANLDTWASGYAAGEVHQQSRAEGSNPSVSTSLKEEQREVKKYLPWAFAGGPNECKHGYADGIPCPQCDAAKSMPLAMRACPECEGTGEWQTFVGLEDCPTCDGKKQVPVTPPASTESKSLGEIYDEAYDWRAMQFAPVTGTNHEELLRYRVKLCKEWACKAVESAVSLWYKGEIIELWWALKRIRDTVEFGPFFGQEATSCVIEADQALDKYRSRIP